MAPGLMGADGVASMGERPSEASAVASCSEAGGVNGEGAEAGGAS